MIRALLLTASVAALLVIGAPAYSQHSSDVAELTAAQVTRQLTERGFDVRSIIRWFDIYKVEVATIDGSRTVFMGVDPHSGRLLPHAFINPPPPARAQAEQEHRM